MKIVEEKQFPLQEVSVRLQDLIVQTHNYILGLKNKNITFFLFFLQFLLFSKENTNSIVTEFIKQHPIPVLEKTKFCMRPLENFGFGNFGNTCFMNGAFQSLLRSPYLPVDSMKEASLDSFSRCFYNLFVAYSSMDGKEVNKSLLSLLSKIWNDPSFSEKFPKDSQCDAGEFLLELIGRFEEELSVKFPYKIPARVTCFNTFEQAQTVFADFQRDSNSPFSRDFGGMFWEHLICLQCGHLSTSFSTFTQLDLSIPNKTTLLVECIAKFCEPEIIEDRVCDYKSQKNNLHLETSKGTDCTTQNL